MNRVIKFRAWDAENKIMGVSFNVFDPEFLSTGGIFPDSCVFMQFVGLHDKNGKEIYEGDIVKGWVSRYPDSKTKGCIVYNVNAQAFQLRYENCFNGHANEFMHHYHFFEVIGNIYQNPERL